MTDGQRKQFIEEQIGIFPADCEMGEFLRDIAKLQPCDDAISRQAVLDALDEHRYSNEFCEEHHIDQSINLGMAHIAVNELPPVTPQVKSEDIAKAFQFGMALGFGEKHDEMDKVVEEIKKVVTPQPKTGWWKITKPFWGYECSVCGRIVEDTVGDVFDKYPYCHCGARMIEPQESEGEE